MMYELVLFYTFIGLVIFFVSVEVYRYKTGVSGILIEFYPSVVGIDELISSRMKVRLKSGQIVDAEAMRCTMCLGNFAAGDEIRLIRSNNKYYVNLPFTLSKKKLCSK